MVLPAFNEEAGIERLVRATVPVLDRLGGAYEILVVDDGSTDRTAEIASRLAAADPAIRVLRHPTNQGYGAALRTGFDAARKEWILLLDADGQFRPEEVDRFVAAAPGADLVVGYRRRRADPGHRRIFAAVWGVLMRGVLGVRVRDVNCGFKLMRASVIQSLDLRSRGALISAEFLAKASRAGAVSVEVPVTHLPRAAGRQTGGSPLVLLRAYYELVRLGWGIRAFRAPPATTSKAARGERAAPRGSSPASRDR